MCLLSAITCELDLDLCYCDADQAFVQSSLDEVVSLRLPKRYGSLSGKFVRLYESYHELKEASQP